MVKTTYQLDEWSDGFGNSYTDRNEVDYTTRLEEWREILGQIRVDSILEIGCNRGHNLEAIKEIDGNYCLYGIDPNEYALSKIPEELNSSCIIINTSCYILPFENRGIDLVFTSGVLIHIAPEDIEEAMDEICRVANRYLLLIEYESSKEEEIEYRGLKRMLFKRDIELLMKKRPFVLISKKRMGINFSNSTYYLYKRI